MTRLQLRLVRFAYSGPTATWPLDPAAYPLPALPETPRAAGSSGPTPAGDPCVFSAGALDVAEPDAQGPLDSIDYGYGWAA